MLVSWKKHLLLSAIAAGMVAWSALPAGAGSAEPEQPPVLAPTPPMGWNSWDAWGMTISGDQFKRSVDWLHTHLQPFGWQYAIIDEGWYLQHPEKAGKPGQGFTIDASSRFIPDPKRFPGGLKELADYTHAQGMKFGIHLVRGIPREAVDKNLPVGDGTYHAKDAADLTDKCRWNDDNYGVKDNAAGRAYYDSLGALYAGWGVDYLKIDCISQPYDQHEIHMVSSALAKSGRAIVLSLSPGPTPLPDADDVVTQAQLWRISDDFWDVWSKPATDTALFPQTVVRQAKVLAAWEPHVGPGHWADADMLPIGYLGPHPGWGVPRVSRLTFDEQRTVLTLWSIARSPLILGANVLQMDSFTESLLTNPEVITVDQHSTGNTPVAGPDMEPGKAVVWRAEAADGKGTYLSVSNFGDSALTFSYPWKEFGLKSSHYTVRDLWLHQDLGRASELKVQLPAHGSMLFKVESARY
jgi:alpha-galactosidase